MLQNLLAAGRSPAAVRFWLSIDEYLLVTLHELKSSTYQDIGWRLRIKVHRSSSRASPRISRPKHANKRAVHAPKCWKSGKGQRSRVSTRHPSRVPNAAPKPSGACAIPRRSLRYIPDPARWGACYLLPPSTSKNDFGAVLACSERHQQQQ